MYFNDIIFRSLHDEYNFVLQSGEWRVHFLMYDVETFYSWQLFGCGRVYQSNIIIIINFVKTYFQFLILKYESR
jgi:hypothetical protein